MRVVEVDEHDSRWEDHGARFRLCVFDGPESTVTALDFIEAQIHDVLEAAELAGKAGKLWSVALVVDAADTGRGLVWLSGMDYNAVPETATEWRRRATMQNRYLMAETRRGKPPVLPDGRRVIRVFPDHGHRWPLWESFTDKYAMEPSDLGLSSPLEERLRAWYDEWQGHGLDWRPDDAWLDEGHRLVDLMRGEIGEFAEIRPDFDR